MSDLCAFIEDSGPYGNILQNLIKVMRHLYHKNDTKGVRYIAHTGLKILEDAYRHFMYFQMTYGRLIKVSESQRLTLRLCESDESEIEDVLLWFFQTIDFRKNRVEKISNSLSLYSIIINWLLCHYISDCDEDRRADSLFCIIDDIFTTLYSKDRYPISSAPVQLGDIDISRVSDKFCTEIDMSLTPEWPHITGDGILFEKCLSTMTLGELFVLREIGYLYRSRVDLHVILSALCFVHEIRDLPFSSLRGLSYVYGLCRRFLSPKTCRVISEEDIKLPTNLFQDQPIDGISTRPVSLWWQTLSSQKVGHISKTVPVGSLFELAFLAPQYARLRVKTHYDISDKRFNQYCEQIAHIDSHAIQNIVNESLDQLSRKFDHLKSIKDKSILVAHTSLLCGGPISVSARDIVNVCCDSSLVEDEYNKIDYMSLSTSNQLYRDKKRSSQQDMCQSLINVSDWIWMADSCMLIYELCTKYGARGLGTFEDIGHDELDQTEYLENLNMKFRGCQFIKDFNRKPYMFFEETIRTDEITYHFFRHNPKPIRPRSLLRKFLQKPNIYDPSAYVKLVPNL